MTLSEVHSETTGGSFRNLLLWQRAVQLSLATYKLTASFPDSEKFGLTSQLRRASVSVASNIAEGYGRATQGEFVQFLGNARGSNCELQTQLVIAAGLRMGSAVELKNAKDVSQEVAKMLVALMKRLRNR
jgi:four helix bundle protein